MDNISINPVNDATRDVKSYLTSFGYDAISQEVMESAIEKILQKSIKEDRAFIHMQLFLHLPFPELESIQDEPDDFVYLMPPMTFPGLPIKTYSRLIVEGNLISHFFQMSMVLRKQPYINELISEVMELYLKDEKEKYLETYPHVLFMLAKLSRWDIGSSNVDTLEQLFSKLLQKFVESKDADQHEKLAVMLRLIGVSFMRKTDYEGSGTDVVELLEEYSYDLSHRVATDTLKYFSKLFKKEILECDVNPKILSVIGQTIKQLNLTDEDSKKFKEARKTSKISWLDFIGIHAFLTNSILEKYSKNDDIFNLKPQVLIWAQYKPKLTKEDYQGEIVDFDRFFAVIKKFGQKEKDRDELLPQFLKFSYSEMFLRKEGLKIADKYLIPGADYDTALKYIKKAVDFESMPSELRGCIPETIKMAVLKLLCSNLQVKPRREELIAEVFKTGVHAHFSLYNFAMDLNQVCSKVGSIEKEDKDTRQIEHNEDLVYNVCFQNPKEAVESLLKQSLRSQQFKVLKIAQPFLRLQLDENSKHNIINFSWGKIMERTEENDQFFDSVIASVSNLIENSLMKPKDMFDGMKSQMREMFLKNEVPLEKISKFFMVLLALANAVKSNWDEEEIVKHNLSVEISSFANRILAFSYSFLNLKTYKSMLLIRRMCLKIKDTLLTPIEFSNSVTDEDINSISTLGGIESLGFLYIREPKLRFKIKSLVKENDPSYPLQYNEAIEHLLTWMLNSESDIEWNPLIEFINKVLFPTYKDLWNLKNPIQMFSHCLLAAYQCSVNLDEPFIIRQFLKFYKESIVQYWVKEKICMDPKQQIILVQTLSTLALEIDKVMSKRLTPQHKNADDITTQQLLLMLLDVMNLIVESNPEFETSLRDKILDVVTLLPRYQGKCEPIWKCIIERVIKNKAVTMFPLPS